MSTHSPLEALPLHENKTNPFLFPSQYTNIFLERWMKENRVEITEEKRLYRELTANQKHLYSYHKRGNDTVFEYKYGKKNLFRYMHITHGNGDIEKYTAIDNILLGFHEYYDSKTRTTTLRHSYNNIYEEYDSEWKLTRRYNSRYIEDYFEGRLVSVSRRMNNDMIVYNKEGLPSVFKKYPRITSYYQPSNKIASYFTYDFHISNMRPFKDGEYRLFYPDGKVARKGKFKHDEPVGIHRSYHPNGRLKRIEIYRKHKLLKSINFSA